MNKSDIAKALKNEGVKDADATVDKLVSIISLALSCGEEVVFRNLGKLRPRTMNAVTRRNPQTGEAMWVPERRTVSFTPSRVLRTRLNRTTR